MSDLKSQGAKTPGSRRKPKRKLEVEFESAYSTPLFHYHITDEELFPPLKYSVSIHNEMKYRERSYVKDESNNWTTISERSRGVDMILTISKKLRINIETLFVSMSIFDRFFMLVRPEIVATMTTTGFLGIVVCCTMLGVKYTGDCTSDKINYSNMTSLVGLEQMSPATILGIELYVTDVIGWNFMIPTIFAFLRYYIHISKETYNFTNSALPSSSPSSRNNNVGSEGVARIRRRRQCTRIRNTKIGTGEPLRQLEVLKRILRKNSKLMDQLVDCISECVLLDSRFLLVAPSKVAATVVLLSRMMVGASDIWNEPLHGCSYYSLEELIPLKNHLLESIDFNHNQHRSQQIFSSQGQPYSSIQDETYRPGLNFRSFLKSSSHQSTIKGTNNCTSSELNSLTSTFLVPTNVQVSSSKENIDPLNIDESLNDTVTCSGNRSNPTANILRASVSDAVHVPRRNEDPQKNTSIEVFNTFQDTISRHTSILVTCSATAAIAQHQQHTLTQSANSDLNLSLSPEIKPQPFLHSELCSPPCKVIAEKYIRTYPLLMGYIKAVKILVAQPAQPRSEAASAKQPETQHLFDKLNKSDKANKAN